MPLTAFQTEVMAALRPQRTPESHLAGGAALHLGPETPRRSADIDLFHDQASSVPTTFTADCSALVAHGFIVTPTEQHPTFIRAHVARGDSATEVDWAHDSAYRFFAPQPDAIGGYVLHPLDNAVNKVLALAGRDEARDYVDVLWAHAHLAPLVALVWAAPAKDPGFNPASLLERLARRARPRVEEIARLDLVTPFDLIAAKEAWLDALDATRTSISTTPADLAGCLCYDESRGQFIAPSASGPPVTQYRGTRGGVWPAPVGVLLAPTRASTPAPG